MINLELLFEGVWECFNMFKQLLVLGFIVWFWWGLVKSKLNVSAILSLLFKNPNIPRSFFISFMFLSETSRSFSIYFAWTLTLSSCELVLMRRSLYICWRAKYLFSNVSSCVVFGLATQDSWISNLFLCGTGDIVMEVED